MASKKYVLPLSSVTLDDLARVGGKNASLGEMLSAMDEAGVRVPDGFATTVDAFWLHLDRAGLREPIYAELDRLDARDPRALAVAGEKIRSLVDGETVVVVSSDFTHYGTGFDYVPFRVDIPEKIRALDMRPVERIVGLDRGGFDAYVTETGATICGRAVIDVLLGVLPTRTTGRLLAYDTSGRMTGDWRHSVSYAAIGFWG